MQPFIAAVRTRHGMYVCNIHSLSERFVRILPDKVYHAVPRRQVRLTRASVALRMSLHTVQARDVASALALSPWGAGVQRESAAFQRTTCNAISSDRACLVCGRLHEC
jgi:hypothetical protein